MCKRNTKDPLLRLFLDQYGLHLLSVPRESVAVGDLYVHDGRRVSVAGSVTHFLEPPLEMPDLNLGETMADISGQMSHGVSAEVGMGLLGSFFAALGAGGVVSKVRASYEAKRTRSMKFRISDATRDWVDVLLLGTKLIRSRVLEEHPLYEEDYSYYLVTAVARTPSISVVAEGEQNAKVDLGVEAMEFAEADVGVSAEKSREGEVTFTGNKKLAFGVQLYGLAYDKKRSKLKLKLPRGMVRVLAGERETPESLVKPAFIGGPEGDVFLTID